MRYDEAWHAVVGLAASRHGVFHAAAAAEGLRSTVERWEGHDPRSVARLQRLLAEMEEPWILTDSWFERVRHVVAGAPSRRVR